MKKVILSCLLLVGLVFTAQAQKKAIEPILADALSSPQIQKIFEGRSSYVILANEVVNQSNCDLGIISSDRPIRFWRDQTPKGDGTYDLTATDCIMILDIRYDPLNGYRVLIQDMNTGRNIFLAKSAF